jgi:hypothetical protein
MPTLTAPANTLFYPLTIPQGADWPGVDFPILGPAGQPYDLTGCTAKAQIRGDPDPFNPALYTWSTSPTAGEGLIVLSGTTLTIRVLAVESAPWEFTRGVYDILLTNTAAPVGQRVSRVVMGPVSVSKEVTR